MSSRGFRFFITIDEFYKLLNELIVSMGLFPIYYLYDMSKKKDVLGLLEYPVTQNAVDRLPIAYIFLSENKPDIDAIDPEHFIAGLLGWIAIDIPEEKNNQLKIISLSVKTHWYEGEQLYDNPEGLVFYNRVARQIKKRLLKGVWFCNEDGSLIRPCNGIYYSEGALEFNKDGGSLCQTIGASLSFVCNPLVDNNKLS